MYTGPIVPGQEHPITQDEKTMGLLSHLLGIFAGFVGPLIIMFTKGKDSPWVKDQSTEALNFALTALILGIPTLRHRHHDRLGLPDHRHHEGQPRHLLPLPDQLPDGEVAPHPEWSGMVGGFKRSLQ